MTVIIEEARSEVAAATVDTRQASILGIMLSVAFTVCAVTGLFSWAASSGQSWWPAQPAGLFRLTQGTHLATGVISIPLLLAKLRTVAPKLVQGPLVSSIGHLVERISLLPLVGGSIRLTLEIANGRVRIATSGCPRKLCVQRGWISQSHQAIACLPARILVRVEGGEQQDSIDAYTQ